jgi:predicted dienelactone hydrolase
MSTKPLHIITIAAVAGAMVTAALASPAVDAGPAYSDGPPVAISAPTMATISTPSGKALPVTAVYPTAGGPYPVIVFSHGYGGSPSSYAHLINYWSAHGYIVLAPTHADAGAMLGPHPFKTLVEKVSDPAVCKQRIADAEAVVNSLATMEKRIPGLRGKMDAKRIGMAGHSFGAYVTEALGGATLSFAGDQPNASFADSRLRCGLMLSPPGVGEMGLTSTSWRQMTEPCMVMTGSEDFPIGKTAGAEIRLAPYQQAPPGAKHLLYIEGANHLTFCDVESNLEEHYPFLRAVHARSGLTRTQMYSYVEAGSLAFFDSYLKHDPAARAYLISTDVSASTNGIVRLESR